MRCFPFTVVAAASMLLACAAQAAVSREVLAEAAIVFIGTVERAGPQTGSEIPRGTPAVTVVVEQVIAKPSAVVLGKDSRISVAIAAPASEYPLGTRAIFYTASWIYGETVAVRELAHETVAGGGPEAPAALADVAGIAAGLRDSKLAKLIDGADAAVVGRVVSVGPPTGTRLTEGVEPVSEHDPQWREASVQVESWLKGDNQAQQIAVRFPASIDVAWYNVPKLKTGDRVTLLLHEDRFSGRAAAQTPAGLQLPTFALVAEMDLVPASDAPRIKSLTGH